MKEETVELIFGIAFLTVIVTLAPVVLVALAI